VAIKALNVDVESIKKFTDEIIEESLKNDSEVIALA